MGQTRRIQPKKLGDKLKAIREGLGISQSEVARKLSTKEYAVRSNHVSDYEGGRREPNLIVLLEYARLAGISIDILADDKRCLPTKILKRIV